MNIDDEYLDKYNDCVINGFDFELWSKTLSITLNFEVIRKGAGMSKLIFSKITKFDIFYDSIGDILRKVRPCLFLFEGIDIKRIEDKFYVSMYIGDQFNNEFKIVCGQIDEVIIK